MKNVNGVMNMAWLTKIKREIIIIWVYVLNFTVLKVIDSLPNKDCVMRRCTHCGINKYRQLIEKNNPQINTSTDELKWKLWENIPYEKDGEKRSKMGDKEHSGNAGKLVDDYMSHLDSMSLHQFNKIYQTKQFNICLRSL